LQAEIIHSEQCVVVNSFAVPGSAKPLIRGATPYRSRRSKAAACRRPRHRDDPLTVRRASASRPPVSPWMAETDAAESWRSPSVSSAPPTACWRPQKHLPMA